MKKQYHGEVIMELDVAFVKFDKTFFDDNAIEENGRRVVGFLEGSYHKTDLLYYRKYYDVHDVVSEVIGNMDQCAFYGLTEETLKAIKAKALEHAWDSILHEPIFMRDLDCLLGDTDFSTETVAFSWIS